MYIQDLQNKDSNYGITLAGDFNFPLRVVEWIKSDAGIFADAKEGTTDEKAAFQVLSDLAIDFNLEQLVDKNTRETNILDLVFSDCPEMFSECHSELIKPTTDHNLISFTMDTGLSSAIDPDQYKEQPEISKYNFKKVNHDRLAQVLASESR